MRFTTLSSPVRRQPPPPPLSPAAELFHFTPAHYASQHYGSADMPFLPVMMPATLPPALLQIPSAAASAR